MIMARVDQIKSAQDATGSTATDSSNAAKALQSIGVSVLDANGQLRNMQDILGDVATKWDTLSSTEKSYISYMAAGTRQYSTFESLIMSFSKSQDLATQATYSNGEALKAQSVYLESTSAKIKEFQTSVAIMWDNAISSNTLGDVVQFANLLVDHIVPTLGTILGLVIALNSASMVNGLVKMATNISTAFQNVGKTISGTFTNANIDSYTNALQKLKDAQTASTVAQETANIAQQDATAKAYALQMAQNALSTSEEDTNFVSEQQIAVTVAQAAADNAATEATNAETAAIEAQKVASAALTTVFTGFLGVIGLIVTAVSIGGSIISGVNQVTQAAARAATDAATSYQQESDSLSSLISQYDQIGSKVNQSANDKQTLTGIQQSLISSYGDEAKSINLLNDSYDTSIQKLQALSKAEADNYLIQNKKSVDTSEDEANNPTTNYFSPSMSKSSYAGADYKENLGGIFDNVSNVDVVTRGDSNNLVDQVAITGALNERVAAMKQILENGDELEQKTGTQTKEEKDFLESISTEYTKLLAVQKTAQENASIKLASTNSTDIANLNELATAYQNAVKSGNTSDIDKAQKSFDDLATSVNNALKKSPELKAVWDALVNSLGVGETSTKKATTSASDSIPVYDAMGNALNDAAQAADSAAGSSNTMADQIKNATSAVSDLNGALQTVQSGQSLDATTVMGLIQTYPQLISAVKQTKDGYTIEASALQTLINAKKTEAETGIQSEISNATATINAINTRIKGYNDEEKAIQSLSNAQQLLALNNLKKMNGEQILSNFGSMAAYEQEIKNLQTVINDSASATASKANLANLNAQLANMKKLLNDIGTSSDTKSTASGSSSSTTAKDAFSTNLQNIEDSATNGNITSQQELQQLQTLKQQTTTSAEKLEIDKQIKTVATAIAEGAYQDQETQISHLNAMGQLSDQQLLSEYQTALKLATTTAEYEKEQENVLATQNKINEDAVTAIQTKEAYQKSMGTLTDAQQIADDKEVVTLYQQDLAVAQKNKDLTDALKYTDELNTANETLHSDQNSQNSDAITAQQNQESYLKSMGQLTSDQEIITDKLIDNELQKAYALAVQNKDLTTQGILLGQIQQENEAIYTAQNATASNISSIVSDTSDYGTLTDSQMQTLIQDETAVANNGANATENLNNYTTQLQQANEAAEQQKLLTAVQVGALQDQETALENANTARQAANTLLQDQNNLLLAQQQLAEDIANKNVQVIENGKWVNVSDATTVASDTTAVNNAQNSLNNDTTSQAFDDQKTALENQIAVLNGTTSAEATAIQNVVNFNQQEANTTAVDAYTKLMQSQGEYVSTNAGNISDANTNTQTLATTQSSTVTTQAVGGFTTLVDTQGTAFQNLATQIETATTKLQALQVQEAKGTSGTTASTATTSATTTSKSSVTTVPAHSQGGVTSSGVNLFGEGNSPEAIISSNGTSAQIVTAPTLLNVQGGEQVIPLNQSSSNWVSASSLISSLASGSGSGSSLYSNNVTPNITPYSMNPNNIVSNTSNSTTGGDTIYQFSGDINVTSTNPKNWVQDFNRNISTKI
jgi:hypothetical protein